MVACMKGKRTVLQSPQATTAKRAAHEPPPDRDSVLVLDLHAQPPHPVAGPVQHITSGQGAPVASVRELLGLGFLAQELRNRAPWDE